MNARDFILDSIALASVFVGLYLGLMLFAAAMIE